MSISPRPLPTSRRRIWTWALLSLAWIVGVNLATGPGVLAQDAAKPASKTADAKADTKATDTTDTKTADTKTAAKEQRSLLGWAIHASGPIGGFLLILSFFFVAHVIRLFLEFRLTEAVPPALVDKLEVAIKERKFQEAYDVCRDDNSFLARMVRTGVANLPNGRPEAKEAMNTTAEEIVIGMESKISYLATIGTLGPMIGLVGTIWGMIMSFQEIARAGGQPQSDKVAEGISTALFITLEGVSLSVPAIFFFAFFRNRIAKIAMETNKIADRTINAFWTAAKQPKPQGATV